MAELNAPPAYSNSKPIRYRNVLPDARSCMSSFLAGADLVALLAIPVVGSLALPHTENLQRNLSFWILLASITVMLITSHGGYRRHRSGRFQKQTVLAINCFFATSIAMLGIAVLLGHGQILTRHWIIMNLILTPVMLASIRTMYGHFITTKEIVDEKNGTLVICYDDCPAGLTRAMTEQRLSSNVSGVFYLVGPKANRTLSVWPEVPDLAALATTIRIQNVKDVIFVQHPHLGVFIETARKGLLDELMAFPVRIWLAVDLASNLPDMLKSRSASFRILPIVTDELVNSLNITKRAVDVVGALALLVLTSPVLLAVACLVKAGDAGPVVFRQIRTGAHGQEFTVFKFRTMTDLPAQSVIQAKRGDPRVTRIGRLLRRSSIDELLQLFNVLRGDMSLVGPRPHAPETQVEGVDFEHAVRLYRLRHRVKPGITGLAQIRGQRGETAAISVLEQRVASDLEYIESWSLWLDLAIMFQTLPMMISQNNAY